MNKSQLIKEIWLRGGTGLQKQDIERVVNLVIEEIEQKVIHGESVHFQGFGTFHRERRNARDARNPSDGSLVKIPERDLPTFHAHEIFQGLVAVRKANPTKLPYKYKGKI